MCDADPSPNNIATDVSGNDPGERACCETRSQPYPKGGEIKRMQPQRLVKAMRSVCSLL